MVWSSSDQWGTWSNGGYTLYNNIWGGGAGPQTTVDNKAVLTWLRDRNRFGDVTLGDVRFGYEITSSSGGLDFRTNSFSVSAS